jgi:RHS repeat-associated protein
MTPEKRKAYGMSKPVYGLYIRRRAGFARSPPKGETSAYIYNGLGYRIGNIQTTLKDCYGYYGFGAAPVNPWYPGWGYGFTGYGAWGYGYPGFGYGTGYGLGYGYGAYPAYGYGYPSYGYDWGAGTGDTETPPEPEWPFEGIVKPFYTQTVEKTFVLDYTSPDKDVILEKENGGLTFKFNYGLEKVSALISGPTYGFCNLYVDGKAKVYFHEDRLGSTEYISDDFGGNVLSYIDYDAWGVPTNKATVMLGLRAVDLVAEYTGHPYDAVLGMYFAEARMYDAADRRFVAVDPIKGGIANTATLVQYTYVLDNPLKWVDPWGLDLERITNGEISVGENTIYNVYYDTDTNELYIDFIAGTIAYGVSMLNYDITWSEDGKMASSALMSKSGYNKAGYMLDFEKNEISYTLYALARNSITHKTSWKANKTYTDVTSVMQNEHNGYLVKFDYFDKMMCLIGRKKDVEYGNVIKEATSQWLVTKADLIQLGWSGVTDSMISELNRIQIKYEILSIERVRHFLAQCMHETNKGAWLREGEYLLKSNGGNLAQDEYENMFNKKSYKYKYRGGGYIQTTWDYNYQSFATFMISQAHPELNLEVKYARNTDRETLRILYEAAVNAATKSGYDIKTYTDIVDKGTDYLVTNYAWESAGYWWQSNNLNALVDSLEPGSKEEVDKVTKVVYGEGTAARTARRDYYDIICNVIK